MSRRAAVKEEQGVGMDNSVEKFLLKMRISRDELIEATWKSF